MKLQRLRIEQLRQFRKPVEITAFAPGINLFTGPNESGKSTLVRAIRAAFFERSKSGSVDDLQPWGDSSATPQVSLEFSWQGRQWRLDKGFLKSKRCDLRVDGAHYTGDDAEDRLAELLGFDYAAKGASRPEHWGVPGLLWIEQGTTQDVASPVRNAGGHLGSALGGALGDLAATGGDELAAAVAAERGALLTAGGRPRGEYAGVIEEYTACARDVTELDAQVAEYRQLVDRLDELARQHAGDERDRPWDALRQQAVEAATRLRDVDQWLREQQRETRALEACRSGQGARRDLLAGFLAQAAELTRREAAQQQALRELEDLQAGQAALRARHAVASTAHAAARANLGASLQQAQRAGLQREQEQLRRQLEDASARLATAQDLQQRLRTGRDDLQAHRVDAALLQRIQATVRELEDLALTEQVIATRLQFDLLPGITLRLDDEPVSGRGERRLIAATGMAIDGIGTLRILPGGDDLAEFARRRQVLQETQAEVLRLLGVASPAQAEERAASALALEAAIARDEQSLRERAPQGMERLVEDCERDARRLHDVDQLLAELPAVAGTAPSPAVAEQQLATAEEALRAVEQDTLEHGRACDRAGIAAAHARDACESLRATLADPARCAQERAATADLTALMVEEGRLQQALAGRQARIDAANPEILRQDVERFDRAADLLEAAAGKRAHDLTGVRSALEALGARGLEELRARSGARLELLARRRDELARRAQALDLLHGLLVEKRQALTRRLQQPLQRHLDHYLQLLFPQAQLAVDDKLVPHLLTRQVADGVQHGEFDDLSFGAREQMGLISRLAYADLLQEAGRPTLVILDDALVHSDQERLARMKRILFDAARRHQVLLFTCHPENWRDLGAVARDVREL